ncbi:sialate O-acetylesterase [Oceanicola sp. S124]|uniref:sialate O-acetylesterase n=1 Tax=Oceanicola sp. S124 TaxID=1042378 RepID=UPI00049448DF|nr:sialate O-acetylesterase [Oceanicola sp. S124]
MANIIDTRSTFRLAKAPTSWIIAWGIGQSNMAGRAPNLSSVIVPEGAGLKYEHATGDLVHMVDPTGYDAGSVNKGSLGPSLCREVYEQSAGRVGLIFVNTGYTGTGILPGQEWSDSPSGADRWTPSKNKWNAAIASALSDKLNVVGSCILFSQGEYNAEQIDDSDPGVDKAAWKTAFLDLIGRARTHAGSDRIPAVILQTGQRSDGDTTGYQDIRAGQAELVRDNALVFMGHAGSRYFQERGLQFDTFHFTDEGYDEMGRSAASTILSAAMGARPGGLE